MNILHRVKQNTLQKIQLLLCFYLILLSFGSIAVPKQPALFSEEEIEKRLTALDNRSQITSVAFSPDGNLLAYGAGDNRVRLWDAHSGRLLNTFEEHTQPITSVAFSQDGLILASSSKDKTIHLWDINSKTLIRTFEAQPYAANSIAFHPDGKILVSSSNRVVSLWNIQSGELHRKPFKWQVYKMGAVAFSPDGKMLAIGASDLKVRLWNMDSFKMYKQRLTCTKYQHVNTLDFSPNSRLLSSGFRHGLVCIWDTQSRQLIKRFSNSIKKNALNAVAFNAEGNRLAYSFYDKIYLWDVGADDAIELPITVPETHYITTIDFNPTSAQQHILAYASSEGTVRLWDTQNNKRFGILAGNASGKWFSCIEQQCLCSEQPCVPFPTEEPAPTEEQLPSNTIDEIEPKDEPTQQIEPEGEVSPTQQIEPEGEPSPIPEIEPEGDPSPIPEIEPESDASQEIEQEGSVFLYWLILFILICIAIALFYRTFICKKNAALLASPLPQLPQKYRLLKRARCLTQVLARNKLSEKSMVEAIAFLKMRSTEQTEILAKRLGAKQWEQMTEEWFKVHLPDNFPINLESCLLYFPATDLNELPPPIALQKAVIITLNPEQLQVLRPHGEETSNLWIVPNHIELTNWLLSSDPVQTFTGLLAEQLKARQISPYQTRSGVNKDAVFFGRTQILEHIINREPANYLLVGGRQLGKSSLLKYLHRHYQNHPQVQCHYVTLHGDTLQEQLAVTLGLPSESDLDTVLRQVFEVGSGQRRLFLIDQADQFIQSDMKKGYRILNHFRSVSEEGHCHFIIAGFWEVYYASVLDYQSPLKNFGEAITIAELETEACYDLIKKPMKTMNLRYESESLVENVLTATGQRANLIAIVCNEMVKGLKNHQRVLGKEDMTQALNSETVREALKGWGKLSFDDQENRLDRIIVYATIKQGAFQLADLMSLLETHNGTYTAEQVKQSLERLALSFVIKRESSGRYHYSVPLFREMLLEEDVDDLLRWELKEM